MDKKITIRLNQVLKDVKIFNIIGYSLTSIVIILTSYLGYLYYVPLYRSGEVVFEFYWVMLPMFIVYFVYQLFNIFTKRKYPHFQYSPGYIKKMIQFYKNDNISSIDIDMNIIIGIYDYSDNGEDAKIILKRGMRKILTTTNYEAEDRLRKHAADIIEYVNRK